LLVSYCCGCSCPNKDKIDEVKDSSKRNWNVFHKFAKYHAKILLGDFSAKVGREERKVHMKLIMVLELE
jgi:hypothetical protein